MWQDMPNAASNCYLHKGMHADVKGLALMQEGKSALQTTMTASGVFSQLAQGHHLNVDVLVVLILFWNNTNPRHL